MSKASNQIVTATERNKEQKQKEDFATQNYRQEDVLSADVVAREKRERLLAENQKKQEKTKTKNFDFNFLSDEEFEAEVEYFGYTPHSDLVILIAPKIKIANTEIQMTPDIKNKLMAEQLDKLAQGFRVIAISQKAKIQNTTLVGEQVFEEYKVGDYLFYNGPLIMLHSFQPLNEDLMFYQIRNMDVRFSVTQQQVLKFLEDKE